MELLRTESEDNKPNTSPSGRLRRERDHAGRVCIIIKQVLACVVMAGMAYGCLQLCQRYAFQSVQVAGRSMWPTLPDSNCYLLNRLVYHLRKPKPSDIVVLRDPEDKGYAIKRIVAKPGDSVYVDGGRIFVNGKLLKEPYLEPGTKTFASPKYSAQFWVCGEHQYFVLGDNRNNSTDSRIYGAVPQQNILGVVSP
jgi:signal peptidase I